MDLGGTVAKHRKKIVVMLAVLAAAYVGGLTLSLLARSSTASPSHHALSAARMAPNAHSPSKALHRGVASTERQGAQLSPMSGPANSASNGAYKSAHVMDRGAINGPATFGANDGSANPSQAKPAYHSPSGGLTPAVTSITGDTPSGIIQTGSLTMSVPKSVGVVSAAAQAENIAAASGGWLAGESSVSTSTGITVTLKVPSGKRFGGVIAKIEGIPGFKLLASSISSRDVSLHFVDLYARLKLLKAQRGQILVLLPQAQTIDETVHWQNVISGLQNRINQIEGQIQYLDHQVSWATITATFKQRHAKPVVHHHKHHKVRPGIVSAALGQAGGSFLAVVAGVIIVAGYALPLSILAFTGYGVYLASRRLFPAWRRPARVTEPV
jgi:Domain of unknown function (DUF4349)